MKRHTSTQIRHVLERRGDKLAVRIFSGGAKYGKGNIRWKLWQDEFHPIAITSEEVFHQKANYIHDNPVRKRLVDDPQHWLYSSAREFYGSGQEPLKIDWAEW